RTDEMEANGEDAEVWSYLKLPASGLAVLPDFGVPVQQLGITMATFNSFNTPLYTIGVMTDPWDAETFEPVMMVQTGHALSSTSSAGSPYVLETVQKLFNLYKGSGRYIAIKGDATNVTNIKYITVELLPSCITPMQVEITDIKETSVVVNWLAGTERQWQIACGGDTMSVSEQPYTLTGLQQGQTYSLAVRALCESNEESAWSQEVQFTTNCGVNAMPLTIDCAALVDKAGTNINFTLPNCWQQLRSTISLDSLNRQRKPATEVLERLPKQTTRNYYTYYDYKFGVPYQSNLDKYFGGKAHLMSNCFQDDLTSSKGTYYKWLVMPTIAVDATTRLTFELAWANMQGCTFYNPMNGTYNQVEPVDFRIVVSEDGGETYQPLQKIDLAQYDSTFQQVVVDLSAYAGKDIQVGFYHAMRHSTTILLPAIRLADIRINCTDIYPMEDAACEGYDYMHHGFLISKDSLPAFGETKLFERWANSTLEGTCDSLIRLSITTHSEERDTIYATICAGESYPFGSYLLTESNPEGKPYMLSETTMYGCDSTVYLYLTVLPAIETSLGTKYINVNESYDFNGKLISGTGIYYDTLVAANGCDSVVSIELIALNASIGEEQITLCENELPIVWKDRTIEAAGAYRFDTLTTVGTDSVVYLTVRTLPVYTIDLQTVYINQGESYPLGNQVLTESGAYTETLQTVFGCDSIVSVTLVVMPKQLGEEKMTVCETDMPIVWNGQTLTQAGTYTFETKTTVGTDSVVTLTLTVAEQTVLRTDTTLLTTELPFIFHGKEVLGDETAEGNYDTTLVIEGTPCDTICELHIVVKMPDGITNVDAGNMHLYPTVIAAGEKVNLYLTIGGDVVVTLSDMMGNVVATYQPKTTHIVLDEFYTAGVYLVRLTSSNGDAATGKVIVK
ncbi:MAG: T9SS type A sorting domain-containing protein, partial [Paludibacteraceae bacterium]